MEFQELTKEKIEQIREVEGFPEATDKSILTLSDAPFYTACPNPFIKSFISENGKPYDETLDDYHREPFAADVSEGKNEPVYNAHSYHTKVPYKAIMKYILHYTNPGDIIYDGFCGTGMTGVAAQMCGCQNSVFRNQIEADMTGDKIKWGARKAVLNDLSPVATFIAYNYNYPTEPTKYMDTVTTVVSSCEKKYGWMYKTVHVDNYGKPIKTLGGKNIYGTINHILWSEVFICPNCSNEFVFWNVAVDQKENKVKKEFACPHCGTSLKKGDCTHSKITIFDRILNSNITTAKIVPVMINYSIGNHRFVKQPDKLDIEIIEKANLDIIDEWIPCSRMPEGKESRRNDNIGISHTHHFYLNSSLKEMAFIWQEAMKIRDKKVKSHVMFAHSAANPYLSKMRRYRPDKKGGGPLSGTLYISSLFTPPNPVLSIKRNAKSISEAMNVTRFEGNNVCISTHSSTDASLIPENSIDYIFTDPPFGGILNYSQLNFLWEDWLNVHTAEEKEAIICETQGKNLLKYQQLMTSCFSVFYKVLKPNRWMTVEFHNSKNSVWNAIQESLQRAGFVVADVRVLDKKQNSFKQVNSTLAVKQDLVISAYKPKDSLNMEICSKAGSKETAWAFVRQHLSNLPVVVMKSGKIELISERQSFLLFDRMVAYHIMRGIPIPIDSTDFYNELEDHFLKRDGMYFLPNQVNEYDTARIINDVEPIQFSLIVSNEKSAIAWLYQELNMPQTYAEIQPKFMQEVRTVDKFEAMPELSVLLAENFLQDDKGKWYVPDITKEADVTKLREKNLLKEFEGYLSSKGKLKKFRSEAIRVGFAKLWKEKNYKLIVETAERLPEQIVQEDDKLLMYYDISLGRA